MAITATQQTDIIKAVVGVFNASPGGYMPNLAAAVQAGVTSAQLYDALAGVAANTPEMGFAFSGGATNTQFASALASNMLGNSVSAANLQVAKDFIVANLNANVSKGAIISAAVGFLTGAAKTTTGWTDAATLFANKVTVATAYTIDQSGSSKTISALLGTIATVDTTQASVDNAIAVNSGATYSLAAGATSYNEGDTAVFTLTTTNVVSGTELAYTISGVTAPDITGALTGKATVSQGKATISVVTNKDFTTEGAETMKVALDNGKASATATVADTSTTPTYTVAADAASANEGAKATFTVTSDQTVPDGTTVAYTISGVDAKDTTTALTGNATFTGGKAAITVDLTNDATTEGAETLSVKVGTTTATTTVADTSITPVLGTDTFQVAPGVAGQVAAKIDGTTLLANDVGSDGKALTGTVTVVAGSEVNGTSSLDSGGFILFSPAVGATSGSFKYAVSGVTEQGTVNVLFNTTPVASDGTLAVTEGTQGSGTATATDADAGQTLTYAVVTAATKGTVTLNAATGAYTYDYTGGTGAVKGALAAAATATDTFTFTATDSMGAVSGAKTVTVTTTGVEDGPQVVSPAPAALSVKSGTTTTIKLTDYATDPDTATSKLTFTPEAASALKGTITDNKDGTVSFKTGSDSTAIGTDSFSFTVTDGTTPVSTKIEVGVSNVAPVATDFALTAKTGVTQTVDLTGKATDADGNTLTPTVTVGSVSAGGSAEVLAGKIVYTSTIGFTGTETIKYSVTDGFGGTSTEQTITFTVASNTGGTSKADLLYGSTSAEAIDGLGGDDTIVGGGGLDTITGGDGNDIVTFSDGAVQILGAAGNDTLVINSDAVASTFDLSVASNQMIDTTSKNSLNQSVIVRTFENIDATKSSGAFQLDDNTTFAHNDALGGDVAVTMSVKSGSGSDNLHFSRATGTGIVVQTNDGNDAIYIDSAAGATGTFNVDAGAGNDTIDASTYAGGSTKVHTLAGGAGNDTITNNAGAGSITGGDGNDTITDGTGASTIDGGAGDDNITGGTGNEVLTGGDGSDTITTSSGNDSAVGGAGDDTIDLAGNMTTADTVDGGDGTDTVKITTAVTAVADLAPISNVEVLFSTAAVTLAGNKTGLTTVNISDSADQIVTFNTGATAAMTVVLTGDSTNADSVINSANLALTVVANSGDIDAATTITGGTGTDVMQVKADSDGTGATLTKVTAVETITVVDGGDATATAGKDITIVTGSYATALTIDGSALDAGVSTATDTTDEVLTVTGGSATGSLSVTGGAGADSITVGTGTANVVAGGAGKDTIVAGAATDNLSGGDGDDTFTMGNLLAATTTIDGGAGTDTMSVTATLASAAGFAKVTNVETLKLIGAVNATFAANVSPTTIDITDTNDQIVTLNSGYTQATTVKLTGDSTNADSVINSANVALTVVANAADIDAATTITGGTGTDVMQLKADAGTADFSKVTKVETVTVVDAGDATATAGVDITLNLQSYATALTVDGSALDAGVSTATDTTDEVLTVTGGSTTGSLNVTGGAGADSITVGSGVSNVVDGGAGKDTIVAGASTDNLSGGDGDDTFTLAGFLASSNVINGGAGTDTLSVTAAINSASVMNGVSNIETLATTANVTLAANVSPTTIDITNAGDQIITFNTGYSQATTVKLTGDSTNADSIINSANIALTVTANASDIDAATTITGGTSTDVINLKADNDGTGATLTKTTGIDTITVVVSSTATDDIVIAMGANDTQIGAGKTLVVSATALTNVGATLTFAGTTSETDGFLSITGGAGGDTISGGGAADTIDGGAGADKITGNAGNDILTGGAGADTIASGLGSDSITLGTSAGTDTDADVVSFDMTALITAVSTVADFHALTSTTAEDLISVKSASATNWSAAATVKQSTASAATDAELVLLDSQTYSSLLDAGNAADNLHHNATNKEYLFVWTDSSSLVHVSWGRQDAGTEASTDQFVDLVKLTGVSISNLDIGDFTFVN